MAITLWHVNPDGFVAEACSGECSLGLKSGDHFTTEFAAQCEADERQSSQETKRPTARKSNTPAVTSGANKVAAWADPLDIDLHSSLANEIHVHPQGKFAVITPYGTMHVYKGHKSAKTGGTIKDIQNGRGSWKLAKRAGEFFDAKAYARQFPRIA